MAKTSNRGLGALLLRIALAAYFIITGLCMLGVGGSIKSSEAGAAIYEIFSGDLAKILVIVAFFRELLGSGTLLGFNILNYEWIKNLGYLNNGLMLMPPMALIICACIIWYQRAHHKELQEN